MGNKILYIKKGENNNGVNNDNNKNFIKVFFEGEGIASISLNALTYRAKKSAIIKGKVGKKTPLPIKKFRRGDENG